MSIVALNDTSEPNEESSHRPIEIKIRLASCDAAQAPVPRRRSLAGAWIAFAVVVAVLVGFAVLMIYQLYMRLPLTASNTDGQLDAADLAWNSLQVWRDLDQDGVSDAGELLGLEAMRISRIGAVVSTTNATGGSQAGTTVNGNFIAQSASFTREVDGVQANRTVGAIDLESNPFYREFTMAAPLTEQAKALPRMQGSGPPSAAPLPGTLSAPCWTGWSLNGPRARTPGRAATATLTAGTTCTTT